MLTSSEWITFLGAAALFAILPGPAIFYVLARSVRGGRVEGVRSALGGSVGGMVHVVGAALGLSAVLATSAAAFTVLKLVGAAYLVYLGLRTLWERDPSGTHELVEAGRASAKPRAALTQGIVTEVLNPKTALFFLAFVPQFVHPERGSTMLTFLALGLITVVLGVLADLLVAFIAGPLAHRMTHSRRWRKGQRITSGATMIGLGGALGLAQQ